MYANRVYSAHELLTTLRAMLSKIDPAERGAEELAYMLFVMRYLDHEPPAHLVEAALEALQLDGEVAA